MMLEDDELREVRTSRRAHRSRRIDVMREWDSGIVDDRPTKERFSREFKKAKIKHLKNPVENIGEENCVEGLVLEVHRRTCEVRLDERDIDEKKDNLSSIVYQRSGLSSNTVTAMYRATTSKQLGEFPAVGDRVLLGLVNDGEDSGDGVGSQKYCVVRVLPRKSELKRPGPRDTFYKQQTLAANIDQVVIVASVTQPEFNYGFMDRFLLASNLNSLPFILVLTKMDLLPNGEADLSEDIRDFMSIADKVIPVSVKTGVGLDDLRNELLGKSSVFSGMSGVGKSSLVNALVPHAALATGEVRERDGKGRHTTISSSLFDLPGGGIVIDTPGIRGIGLMDLDKETLAKIFPGFFEDDIFTCKFSNCIHVKEAGCAVRAAVESGKLSRARYRSYLRILNSSD
ncbi:MAG: ribosome small subunit-dependent GTPase A [Fibrobacter sp.]|jgi:ribosome biogenesis GTPase|uniref:ribosome small subunit-dependent GTPase A n=1 Tax=unclassified Fibrobacter TaxID=2634177 RepID=UPI00090F75B5|nr:MULTISPECIES: ribosome small subunit-dependent GTPase A [unclassified Fibrobacter]MBO6135399.1 ribosome small subunit-dependent GTPase A [Fibrobacter sp.]MBQ3721837.1 ribosome small subunit-dependent GTPase A [Fibrobacter sp.]SHH68265.1 ribosome biogenesis GTPase [Fibrobacter sp. UWCM]SOE55419.1 ribosome biogenesis GTPase [Fibrobacter sp. UWT3]